MNRRSFLSFLGLASAAGAAAEAAASAPIDYSDLASTVEARIGDAVSVIDLRRDGSSKITIDAGRFQLRVSRDNALAERINNLIAAQK